MTVDDGPGEEYLCFTRWAASQGIEINGVAPANFAGRRLGLAATRLIEANEIIITVPLATMFTIDCVPASFRSLFPDGTSIHGILAAFLTLGDADLLKKWDPCRRTWPTRQDFERSTPILWPEHLRMSTSAFHSSPPTGHSTLPPAASGLWNSIDKEPVDIDYESRHQNILAQQEKRLQDAWRKVISVFPDADWDAFSYHWLILNTRSFFYVTPGEKDPEDWNDAIALVPFADYINHTDKEHIEVSFDGQKYTFKTTQRHEKGEEIYTSYGSHPNDFLFIEYGFYLDHNEFDAIYLDDIVLRELSRADKEKLKFEQYLGNYEVTSAGACFRTEVAACMKYMTRKDWRNYILGHSTRGVDSKKTANVITNWIDIYLNECKTTIEILEDRLTTAVPKGSAEADPDEWKGNKLSLLLGRWNQIRRMCEDALKALACP